MTESVHGYTDASFAVNAARVALGAALSPEDIRRELDQIQVRAGGAGPGGVHGPQHAHRRASRVPEGLTQEG